MEQCFLIGSSGIVHTQALLEPAALPYNYPFILNFNLSILCIYRNQRIFHLIALLAHPIQSSM